jgi:hypothetical protein
MYAIQPKLKESNKIIVPAPKQRGIIPHGGGIHADKRVKPRSTEKISFRKENW